jgi:hypothetical protein
LQRVQRQRVARPRGGTADLMSTGHWCRSGRGCAQTQGPRAEGRIRRKTAVMHLVAISATATIGNGGNGCCARGGCAARAEWWYRWCMRGAGVEGEGGECGSAGNGGRGWEARKAVYVMEEQMHRRCTWQWCRTSQLRYTQARAENADGADPHEVRRHARGGNEGNAHIEE